jgi:hypothetical protein
MPAQEETCQMLRRFNARARTSARERLRRPRRESSFARKCITCGREGTVPDPPNKPSRLACPRPGARASSCVRRKGVPLQRVLGARPRVTAQRQSAAHGSRSRENALPPLEVRYGKRAVRRHRIPRSPDMLGRVHGSARQRKDRPLPEGPPVRALKAVEIGM